MALKTFLFLALNFHHNFYRTVRWLRFSVLTSVNIINEYIFMAEFCAHASNVRIKIITLCAVILFKLKQTFYQNLQIFQYVNRMLSILKSLNFFFKKKCFNSPHFRVRLLLSFSLNGMLCIGMNLKERCFPLFIVHPHTFLLYISPSPSLRYKI